MKYFTNEDGVTLIEVIVAMLILMIAVIPMLSGMTNLFKTIYSNRNDMSANFLAVQAAEGVRAEDFDNVDDQSFADYEGSEYSMIQEVSEVPNSDSKLKQVTIRIMDDTKEKAKLSLILYKGGEVSSGE